MRGLFLLAFAWVQVTCYPFGYQNQEFIWDINRCSNINPIFDRRTVQLVAGGVWYENGIFRDQICHAIRRDLKVSDDTAYSMTADFMTLTTNESYVGFVFNLWDDINYDYVVVS